LALTRKTYKSRAKYWYGLDGNTVISGISMDLNGGTCPVPRVGNSNGGPIPGSDVCIRFPFGGLLLAEALLAKLGEFQMCNRPALRSSFLSLSTAANPAGFFGTGRIDWPCEWMDCIPSGGLITFTKDWFHSPEKSDTREFTDGVKVDKRLVDITGETSVSLGLFYNASHKGVDFMFALTGRLKLSVMSVLGLGGSIAGFVTVHKKPAPLLTTCSVMLKIEGEVEVFFVTFKVTIWTGYDAGRGWVFHLDLPFKKQSISGIGKRRGGYR
jgi:hypothetical protein